MLADPAGGASLSRPGRRGAFSTRPDRSPNSSSAVLPPPRWRAPCRLSSAGSGCRRAS